MKRRDFLSLGAGSAIAVAAPLPRLALAAPAARAPRNLYVWAMAMARAGNPISHQTLGLALKVSTAQAQDLIGRLVASGVLNVPNAAGIARAARPALPGMADTAKPVEGGATGRVRQALREKFAAVKRQAAEAAEQATGLRDSPEDTPQVTKSDPDASSPPDKPPHH